MEKAKNPSAKKAPRITALRCLNPACEGLLAYEVQADNVLYLDLAWTARREGEKRYFPCPKCGGKNIVEAFRSPDGKERHRVSCWET